MNINLHSASASVIVAGLISLAAFASPAAASDTEPDVPPNGQLTAEQAALLQMSVSELPYVPPQMPAGDYSSLMAGPIQPPPPAVMPAVTIPTRTFALPRGWPAPSSRASAGAVPSTLTAQGGAPVASGSPVALAPTAGPPAAVRILSPLRPWPTRSVWLVIPAAPSAWDPTSFDRLAHRAI